VPLLLWLYRRRPADGVVAWTWFTYYGITRSIAEIWREPGFTVAGLSGGQLVALPTILIGAVLLFAAIRAGKHTNVRAVLERGSEVHAR
jgi:prolipoprotein diacylglyceryltransferase